MLDALKKGQALTETQMRQIKGGVADSGTCCWHSADWSAYGCGISRDTAIERATDYATGSGNPPGSNHGYWCCQSCPQIPVLEP